jgi:Flp pilus assembly protein TadD
MVRLNLAVALIRIGDFQRAVDELKMLELPSGPGISRGTQQYLLGLAYEGLGDAAAARQAWQTAATVGGTLTDDGPLIADLVASKAAISLHP